MMKNQISIVLAQAVGKLSYQSLLPKNYSLQAQINHLQAQLRNLQADKSLPLGYPSNQPHLYEFPVAPSANSQPLIVPRLSNIPDSRVFLLGTNH